MGYLCPLCRQEVPDSVVLDPAGHRGLRLQMRLWVRRLFASRFGTSMHFALMMLVLQGSGSVIIAFSKHDLTLRQYFYLVVDPLEYAMLSGLWFFIWWPYIGHSLHGGKLKLSHFVKFLVVMALAALCVGILKFFEMKLVDFLIPA